MAASNDQPPSAATRSHRAYGPWLREKHGGKRVCKVVVDAGFTCPNRDGSKGYGGCSYCNVDSFTPALPRSLDDVREQVERGIDRARRHYGAEKFILYFQPNTNTHAPVERLAAVFDEALAVCPEEVVGLAVGTRPDCMDDEKTSLLESYTKRFEVDLELGMESIYDPTLERIRRGCSHAELVSLLDRLQDTPLGICLHTIFGFPWETRDEMLAYAEEINRFPQVGFVKLHHLHVVEGSILAKQWRDEPFPLFTLEGYTDFLCDFLPRLRADIVIERLFGVADTELLLAPRWNLPKAKVQRHLEREFARREVVQGSRVRDQRSFSPLT